MSHYSRNRRGFTLTELIVSIGIISVILTVVVSNQSSYTDGAALINLADNISLTISQAQAYGIGVREFSPGSSEFTASYGLTFSLLAFGSNTAYLYFADRNGDEYYNGGWTCPTGGSSECLEKVDILRGNYIEDICALRTPGTDLCSLGRVDISFARPNIEATLRFFSNSGQFYNPANIEGARIVLRSPGGARRSVIVYNTGQISVE